MNRTEEAYSTILQGLKLTGLIVEWWFEAHTLRLADRSTFTPDFSVLHPDGSFEFIDVKGGGPIEGKSATKIRVAAEIHYAFRFSTMQLLAKKHGGGWKRTEF